jgi:pimeloyl-ACP methyl ester carboxylesterase
MKKPILSMLLGLMLLPFALQASDLEKEQRWADQIVDFLIEGEAEWLDVGDHEALAIYTESAQDEVRGGVILAHGSGVHPNWQEVVYPLRTGLAQKGWATLSIQMPVLHNEAEYHEYAPLFDEVAPRLDAAIKNLQDKGINNISIVAHSLGSAMSAYYLSNHPKAGVKSFVAVGMPGPREDPRMDTLKAVEKIKLPVLDLYGEKDLEYVLESAPKRKTAVEKTSGSRQVIPAADHFFVGHNAELVESVDNWLSQHNSQ